jgi:hypothetical protein
MSAANEREKAILRACGRYVRKKMAPLQKQLLELQRKDISAGVLPGSRNVTKEVVSKDGLKSRYRYDPTDGTWNLVR